MHDRGNLSAGGGQFLEGLQPDVGRFPGLHAPVAKRPAREIAMADAGDPEARGGEMPRGMAAEESGGAGDDDQFVHDLFP
jgi:hypothetical protein